MKRKNRMLIALTLMALLALLAGCMSDGVKRGDIRWYNADTKLPEIPERLRDGDHDMPSLKVYDTATKSISEMDIETYVAGVVAGEMKNSWPLEALKAQAILARTFVMKFCADKKSRYENADISTDVTEAQAYAADDVNDQVRRAVDETRGLVMSYEGEYPYAWFHAHSGGMTDLPSVSLDYKDDDPAYLKPVESEEPEEAPEDAKHWTARFTKRQVAKACADAGAKVDRVETVEVGEKGESGRAKTLLIDGTPVSAASFRIQIGANALKSTLIEDIRVDEDAVTFTGRGFGHGVGMSQWGAYAMAERGDGAEEIIRHYFADVDIVDLW